MLPLIHTLQLQNVERERSTYAFWRRAVLAFYWSFLLWQHSKFDHVTHKMLIRLCSIWGQTMCSKFKHLHGQKVSEHLWVFSVTPITMTTSDKQDLQVNKQSTSRQSTLLKLERGYNSYNLCSTWSVYEKFPESLTRKYAELEGRMTKFAIKRSSSTLGYRCSHS